ncbi:MAG: oxaloacetate-decarboxylating malate dehydrogenase, partial [Candidatus Limnocylindria bacterium]
VGTDNPKLLADPLYVGYRQRRLRGADYDEFLEAFVDAVVDSCPRAVLQWEDFKQHNAIRSLVRYRHRFPSFNDDVQGTGAVVLAGLLAARAERGGIGAERFLFMGAGAAAVGIAGLLRRELDAEGAAGSSAMLLLDSKGLIAAARPDLADDQRPFAVDEARVAELGLHGAALQDPVAIARAFRPTVLLGTTGCRGAFSEALVREVAQHDPAPIILPLSNPSDRAEATPEDVLRWTEGRALIASGSPFPAVATPRGTRVIGQANNVFVFPGVGLGAIVAEARELTDDAFLVAAHELAAQLSPLRLAAGAIYPPISDLRNVARAIAVRLVRHLRDTGYGRQFRDEEIEPAVDGAMWSPVYPTLVAG